jgi:hypothetical protein
VCLLVLADGLEGDASLSLFEAVLPCERGAKPPLVSADADNNDEDAAEPVFSGA